MRNEMLPRRIGRKKVGQCSVNGIFYFLFLQFMFLCPSVYYFQSQQNCVYHLSLQKVQNTSIFFTFKWKHTHTHSTWGCSLSVCLSVVCVSMYVFMHTVRDYFLSDWLCGKQKRIQMCRLKPLSMLLTWAEIIAAALISRMKTSSSGFSKWASSSTSTMRRSRHATVRHLLFLSRGELVNNHGELSGVKWKELGGFWFRGNILPFRAEEASMNEKWNVFLLILWWPRVYSVRNQRIENIISGCGKMYTDNCLKTYQSIIF